MDHDTTPPFTPDPPDPEPAAAASRWPRRVGALAGVAVLSAAAIGFGTAGAQTDDEDGAVAAEPPVVALSGVISAGPIGPGEMTAFDECLAEALPDDAGFSFEELPFEDLRIEELSIEELGEDGVEAVEPSPKELEALDAEFEAVLQECESQLSDEERAEMARWDDFHACIESQFDELGPLVTIDGEDGFSVGSFGEDAGAITVTKAADGSISVDPSGSATVSEGPGAEEELFFPGEGACEHLVPEDTEA